MTQPPRPPEPDARDPLAESSPQRRLWAARLARGYNRASWARALDVTCQTVDSWDREEFLPRLEILMRACELIDYSLDEIVYGPGGRPLVGREPDLDRDGIRAALNRCGATDAQRAAFGAHADGPGKWERFTRTYVSTWIASWAAAIDAGAKAPGAAAKAHIAATNARANVDAVAQRAKPIPVKALRDLGSPTTTMQRPRRTTPAPSQKRTR